MPRLKIRIAVDPTLLNALARHAEKAVENDLLSEEEEASNAVADEIIESSLRLEVED